MEHDRLLLELADELDSAYNERAREIRKLEDYGLEQNDDELGVLRKALIVLLYAHFEGYCKFSLKCYVSYINRETPRLSEIKHGLLSACMEEAFKKLTNDQYKPVHMRRDGKEDKKLQTTGRRKEFLTNYDQTISGVARINEDICIDTESNLWAHILENLLFKLDLDYDIVDRHESEINRLLLLRNAYAHGDKRQLPSVADYKIYRESVFELMRHLREEITSSFDQKAYLREESACA